MTALARQRALIPLVATIGTVWALAIAADASGRAGPFTTTNRFMGPAFIRRFHFHATVPR